MEIFELTKRFPREEKYSLVDQMRRSSRSVSANLAEAWRKRRYNRAFIAKLSDCEAEAAETQVWIEYACQCNYLDTATAHRLDRQYHHIIAQIVKMISASKYWTL